MWARSSVWKERHPPKVKVTGSKYLYENPVGPV